MSANRPNGSLSKELKTLGLGSFTFLIPSLLTRGLSFVLTPVYTRFMSPDEYGIVGLGTTLWSAIALLLGCGVPSAASRLYHTMPGDAARVRLGGASLGFLLVVPPALAMVVEILGSVFGLSPFRSVPYSPFLRLVLWSSVLVCFQNLTLNMLMAREQHRLGASLNAFSVLATAGFTVLFVVELRRGAYGQLLALLLSNAAIAAWSVVMVWRLSPPVYDRRLLKELLAFGLPLVPHEMSKWLLAASDRVILERFVSAADLGRYSLGYSFGSAVGIFLNAVATAFFPIVNRKLAVGDPENDVPYLGSVVVIASTYVSLIAATAFPPFIRLVTTNAYDGAGPVVPWVAIGFFFQALYLVWSQGTFFAKKTGAVAGVTFVGAIVNIGLNLVFIPRFGYIAAAVTTAIGYAVMAGLHGWLSRRVRPIPWEWGRYVRTAAAALVAYFFAVLPPARSDGVELALRLCIGAVAFPLLLVLLRAVRPNEVRRVKALWSARKRR